MSASTVKSEPIMIPAVMEGDRLEPIEKLEAHERGQLHLAISVFLFDGDGRLLIQRRAPSKYHCPGQWANTCCTHPHWGEPLAHAARRRLNEELGIGDVPIEERRTIDYRADVGGGLTEHERVTIYTGTVDPEALRFDLNPDEVDRVDWLSPRALMGKLEDEPETLTPWFRIYLGRFPGLVI